MALVFWAAIGGLIAAVAACVLGVLSFLLTKRVGRGRWPVVISSCFFPLACLPWGGSVFGFQAVVNEAFLHRDAGLGDVWRRYPLPNGYSILMIDETDNGWVYNPRLTARARCRRGGRRRFGSEQLQLSGAFVLGNRNDGWGQGNPTQRAPGISYFILDTGKGTHVAFANENDFHQAAGKLGVGAVELEPMDVVYRRYRFTWFDAFTGFLLLAPPLAGFVGLAEWVVHVRKRARSAQTCVAY